MCATLKCAHPQLQATPTTPPTTYSPAARTKGSMHGGTEGPRVAELATHHIGILYAPVVVTYGAPCPVVEHLHTALLLVVPIDQSDYWGGNCDGTRDFIMWSSVVRT